MTTPTDDELRKMIVCAPLLEPPAGDIVKQLATELLAAREFIRRNRETDELIREMEETHD